MFKFSNKNQRFSIMMGQYQNQCQNFQVLLELVTGTNQWASVLTLFLYVLNSTSYILEYSESMAVRNDYHKPKHNTRNKNNITIEHCRLSKTLNSHLILSQKLMIDKYSTKSFQTKIYKWLLKNTFYSLLEFTSMKNFDF